MQFVCVFFSRFNLYLENKINIMYKSKKVHWRQIHLKLVYSFALLFCLINNERVVVV